MWTDLYICINIFVWNVVGKINVFALSDFTMGRCLNLSAKPEFILFQVRHFHPYDVVPARGAESDVCHFCEHTKSEHSSDVAPTDRSICPSQLTVHTLASIFCVSLRFGRASRSALSLLAGVRACV